MLIRYKKVPLSEHMEVFKIVPHEVQELLFDFYALWRKTRRSITIQRWKQEYGYVRCHINDGQAVSNFQHDPVGYLIHASRSVKDFPDRLFKNLRILQLKRNNPLTIEEFEEQIKYVYYEDAEKLPLTRKMAKVFQGLLALDPLARRKRLAKHLHMTEDAIKWQIAEMKRRFVLLRLIELDYYKLGLSRLFLFLEIDKRFQNQDFTSNDNSLKPLLNRYLLKVETFTTSNAKQYNSFQIYTPPWGRRYAFKDECENKVQLAGVKFYGGEPDVYLATGRQVFYNLEPFDFKTGRWMINLRDLRFLINNYLMTESKTVYPSYDFQFDVNRRQGKQDVIEFDSLDLQICEQFWDLEGGRSNRFTTAHMVSKVLDVPYKEIHQRVERLKKEQVIRFYYWSSLGLSSAFTTLLITKDEFILNNFQKIIAELPVSSVTPLKSLSNKKTRGLLCHTYLPAGLALDHLFQSTFFKEMGVDGFCGQAFPGNTPTRPLHEYYDPVRKWWKWNQLEDTKEANLHEEYHYPSTEINIPGEYSQRVS